VNRLHQHIIAQEKPVLFYNGGTAGTNRYTRVPAVYHGEGNFGPSLYIELGNTQMQSGLFLRGSGTAGDDM
jgi:hypothetical protein